MYNIPEFLCASMFDTSLRNNFPYFIHVYCVRRFNFSWENRRVSNLSLLKMYKLLCEPDDTVKCLLVSWQGQGSNVYWKQTRNQRTFQNILKEVNSVKIVGSTFFLCRKRVVRYRTVMSKKIMSLAQLKTPRKEVERRGWGLKILIFFTTDVFFFCNFWGEFI